ncbi:uncharacterized protein [Nicotiana tomentosiformis]|uniref:uncharacterized protein n=1 Tax=Nicotiana tomentosiformis TaxID=4098 RepID=UPI00388CC3E9
MRDTIAEQNDTIAELRRGNNVRPQARKNVPLDPIVNQENPIDDFNDIDFNMVEAIFDCHNYSEGKKVKLVVVEFYDNAAILWKKLTRDRVQEGHAPITTWAEIKRVRRKRFVPSHIQRELQHRLQTLKQRSMFVDEYFKAMDMAMIQANCMEEEEATMARFLNERKNKRKQTSSRKGRSNAISKKPLPNQEMKSYSRPQEDKGKGKFENKEGGKTFNPKPSTPSGSIQCHKCKGNMMHECPSRRNIILIEDEGHESEKVREKKREI